MPQKRWATYYGWRVVGAAFALAVFGLGVGFHGPAIYLQTLHATRGWPLPLISTAVTVHFLVGATVVANLPKLHRRFGVPLTTKAGAILLAVGVFGWSVAATPWQLFAATLLSGAGWGVDGRGGDQCDRGALVRPRPLRRMAYNGGNIGGVVFSPLWAAAIAAIGFPAAAAAIGLVMAIAMWILADLVFSRTPQQMGLMPDGDERGAHPASVTSSAAKPLPGLSLWTDLKFVTIATGMALGLFAQIGLIVHLFSLLVPALGAAQAGLAMGLVTLMAIIGRSLLGWVMPTKVDRRLMACASYAIQMTGCVAFIAANGTNAPLLLLGVILFGVGFGNGTWLPPLIAQVEFVGDDVPRVVALIVAISQGTYAFAPVVFGVIREFTPPAADMESGAAPGVFAVAAIVQALAILAFLAGRRR
jgi:hypothetical protein